MVKYYGVAVEATPRSLLPLSLSLSLLARTKKTRNSKRFIFGRLVPRQLPPRIFTLQSPRQKIPSMGHLFSLYLCVLNFVYVIWKMIFYFNPVDTWKLLCYSMIEDSDRTKRYLFHRLNIVFHSKRSFPILRTFCVRINEKYNFSRVNRKLNGNISFRGTRMWIEAVLSLLRYSIFKTRLADSKFPIFRKSWRFWISHNKCMYVPSLVILNWLVLSWHVVLALTFVFHHFRRSFDFNDDEAARQPLQSHDF